jgi:hypothetical protein
MSVAHHNSGTDLFGRPLRHPGECPECGTFRPDGEPPTSHRFNCSQYVDLGVLRWGTYDPHVVRSYGR